MPKTQQKKVKYTIQGYAILGSYDFTIASYGEGHLLSEEKRLKKLGYGSTRVPCTITYSLPLTKKSK